MNQGEWVQACPGLAQLLEDDPTIRERLAGLQQRGLEGFIARYLSDAPAETIRAALEQLTDQDFAQIATHRAILAQEQARPLRREEVDTFPLVTMEEQEQRRELDAAAGLSSLEQGQWASVAFAGGAGTRFFSSLGELARAIKEPNEVLAHKTFDPSEPKGVFPITPVGGLSFYEVIIAEALHAGITCGRMPWVLFLTSAITHARTERFLAGGDFWGFPKHLLRLFQQARVPRLDENQQLIVANDRGEFSWTGDGHGGVYRALLQKSGKNDQSLLAQIQQEGILHLVMHNVDNPAAHPFAPTRLGFHLREGAHFTISSVRKTCPEEKVGVALTLRSTGKVEVVEYNVLDQAIAAERDPATGRLLFEAANINTNLIAAEAVQENLDPTVYTGKKVESRIGPVHSSSMEMLNQHITRLLDPGRIRAYELSRSAFFMPTKNITGVDSVESTTRMLSLRHQDLLTQAGATVSPQAWCDLHPACGTTAEELAARGVGPSWSLHPGSRLYLCARSGDRAGGPLSGGGLVLEEGSSLVVECARPYGEIVLDGARHLGVRPTLSSAVFLGRGLVVRRGVRVILRIGPGARLTLPDHLVISSDLNLQVPRGANHSL